jgi:Short C-terminal domain
MLFLYRPRETWMPYRSPRAPSQQGMYNMELQQRFEATRRVPRPAPAPETSAPHKRDTTANLEQLSDLHASGVLTDSEFAAAKARLTGTTEATA